MANEYASKQLIGKVVTIFVGSSDYGLDKALLVDTGKDGIVFEEIEGAWSRKEEDSGEYWIKSGVQVFLSWDNISEIRASAKDQLPFLPLEEAFSMERSYDDEGKEIPLNFTYLAGR